MLWRRLGGTSLSPKSGKYLPNAWHCPIPYFLHNIPLWRIVIRTSNDSILVWWCMVCELIWLSHWYGFTVSCIYTGKLKCRLQVVKFTPGLFRDSGKCTVEYGLIWRGSVTILSDILRFFARVKNGDCLRKCRGHLTITARSAARRASTPETSRAKIVLLEKMSFSTAFPCDHHYLSPHKMAAKNHRLSWHCRFKQLFMVQPGAVKLDLWRHWMHEIQVHLVASENQ